MIHTPGRLRSRAAALLCMLGLALGGPVHAGGVQSAVLVELFTSQGCASCPPADALLGELSERDGTVALSLHVDYWDYLGWQDSFAQAECTERQYAYRDSLGTRSVYTPQIVVHGARDVVGSRRGEVTEAIAAARAASPVMEIAILPDGGMLEAELRPVGGAAPGVVWVARYRQKATVEIARGENAGRTITYHNVVQSIERIGDWPGTTSERVMLPQPGAGEGVAVWVQADGTGRVRAAAAYEP
jgi:hypothetical protein